MKKTYAYEFKLTFCDLLEYMARMGSFNPLQVELFLLTILYVAKLSIVERILLITFPISFLKEEIVILNNQMF